MAAVGAWPVPLAPYSHRGGVAGPLGPVRLPWGHGRSPGPRMAAVGAWADPWALYGRRGGVAVPLSPLAAVGAWLVPWAPYGRRGGVVGFLHLVWLP